MKVERRLTWDQATRMFFDEIDKERSPFVRLEMRSWWNKGATKEMQRGDAAPTDYEIPRVALRVAAMMKSAERRIEAG